MNRSPKKIIHLIAAARPNFMKIAPLYHALSKVQWAQPVIVHTGQHYDINMSDAFFKDLSLPEPQVHLGVGSGTHSEQTGRVMIAYEKLLMNDRPNLLKEGIGCEKIERVGNIMIDSLEMLRPFIEKEDAVRKYILQNGSYGLVTLHRPSNVDSLPLLKKLFNGLVRISEKVPLIFPVHPRTWKNLKDNNIISTVNGDRNLHLEEPLSYIPFMNLVFND